MAFESVVVHRDEEKKKSCLTCGPQAPEPLWSWLALRPDKPDGVRSLAVGVTLLWTRCNAVGIERQGAGGGGGTSPDQSVGLKSQVVARGSVARSLLPLLRLLGLCC